MRLESKDKERSSHLRMSEDKQVNEATAALKGMLGIGAIGGAPDSFKENSNKKKPNNNRKGNKGNSKSPVRDNQTSNSSPPPSSSSAAANGDKGPKPNNNPNKNKK
eukprot:CAMPEP_0116102930 /NCGR_PEP_ID=MMETSP0327-20121206/13615_1 /TAXON_ID=44447 /ORGANISM="Pseudo-nitzschia delicatissima, Strain B596" /LENGTH=105 /DNA_ID=CAMNT_0003595009 /DNA_START=338 /DNA_END=652 /DNA_ORIENTATION=-